MYYRLKQINQIIKQEIKASSQYVPKLIKFELFDRTFYGGHCVICIGHSATALHISFWNWKWKTM